MSANPSRIPNVVTIAGSDSGGGAGIQADIKAISATGSYACSVITALTAQNTQGVSGVKPVPAGFIRAQFEAVFNDIHIDAVKIGMLGDVATIQVVAALLREYRPANIVLDPVMVATSGDRLLAEDAAQCLISELLPLADVVTPNLPEALALTGEEKAPENGEQIMALTRAVMARGARSVLVKGGHMSTAESTDIWVSPDQFATFSSPRFETQNTHGTGCTLSSALASFLAQGYDMPAAIQRAKDYITAAIEAADQLEVGEGHGPVNHFYRLHQG